MNVIVIITAGAVLLALATYGLARILALRINLVLPPHSSAAGTPGALDFSVRNIDGEPVDLAQYQGRVVLLVNVASKCILTAQYDGLQKLYDTYKDRGLVIIGFPANNFGAQEPGGAAQIKSFCQTRFGVTFPMMAKISVKGEDKHPLFEYLTGPATAGPFAGEIKWNFAKFLVDRTGRVMARFGPATKPQDPLITRTIEQALSAMD